jgi:hypothetical protein
MSAASIATCGPVSRPETMMTKATGNTYEVRDALKDCGFSWDSENKVWISSHFDAEKWAKYCSCTYYGRKMGRLCSAIKIEQN